MYYALTGKSLYADYKILETLPNRSAALERERYYVNQYRKTHNGLRPPKQFRP